MNVKFGHPSASIEVAAGKTLNFAGTITNATSGGISHLTKTGAGTLTLAGVNTYSGTTNVVAGTLALASATSSNNIAASPLIVLGAGTTLDLMGLDNGPVTDTLAVAAAQTVRGLGSVNGTLTSRRMPSTRRAIPLACKTLTAA